MTGNAEPIGFRAALRMARRMRDPAECALIPDHKSRDGLCLLLKTCALMAGGPGGQFFIGAKHAGPLLGVSHMTIRRWLRTLEGLGLIAETWRGRRCAIAPSGKLYDGGKRVSRGSEYTFLGCDSIRT